MAIERPMDVAELFPVRKSGKQKKDFRDAVADYLENLGYPVTVEKGCLGARNVVVGNPDSARYLVTAHYDTSVRMLLPNLLMPCNVVLFALCQLLTFFVIIAPAFIMAAIVQAALDSFWMGCCVLLFALVMAMIGPANPDNRNDNTSGIVAVLEIARSMPESLRNKVCFVFFDLEEAGMIGSFFYRRVHKKACDHQIVLNLDCVGDGSEIVLFPTAGLKKDVRMLSTFDSICGRVGSKRISIHRKGIYPSDQKQFPFGLGICALNKNRVGLYLSRIHTPRDVVLDETNVNILRAALISWIGSRAGE